MCVWIVANYNPLLALTLTFSLNSHSASVIFTYLHVPLKDKHLLSVFSLPNSRSTLMLDRVSVAQILLPIVCVCSSSMLFLNMAEQNCPQHSRWIQQHLLQKNCYFPDLSHKDFAFALLFCTCLFGICLFFPKSHHNGDLDLPCNIK